MDARSVAKRPEKHGYAMSSARSVPMDAVRDADFSQHMGEQTAWRSYQKSLAAMF